MRRKGQTKDRPEEQLCHEILKEHATFTKLEEQKNIKYINEQEREMDSFVDVYLETDLKKTIIRIMGEYHYETSQKRKDTLQREYLERDGYTVVDLWCRECQMLFLRNKRRLNEKELILAYKEVYENTKDFLEIRPNPRLKWLKKTFHKK